MWVALTARLIYNDFGVTVYSYTLPAEDLREMDETWGALVQYHKEILRFNALHTIYIRNNMGQKCEGNCGLWVLHEILKKTYPENLKKIMGAV